MDDRTRTRRFTLAAAIAAVAFAPPAWSQVRFQAGQPDKPPGSTLPVEKELVQIFSEVESVHPFSVPNAITASADGDLMFAGEGGSLVFLDTSNTVFANAPAVEIKRAPIGKFGVRPAALVLDPLATPRNGNPDATDIVYVAGGRSGLWAMEAHPAAGFHNRAARVDDSRNGSPAIQKSRRWCTDVDFVRVGTAVYLVALFSKKDDSVLRLYELDDVRDVLNLNATETGNEIAPVVEVALEGHPAAVDGSRLLALGLDTEQVNPNIGLVFIALGTHGLARVRLLSNAPAGEGEAPVPTALLSYGPVFGDGTFYNTTGGNPEWYSNFQYIDESVNPAEVQRDDPPLFTDVAVESFGAARFLYASVDHLGWVRFGLDGPWHPSMPIDHHEGQAIVNPWGEIQFVIDGAAPPPDEDTYNYVRRIQIVNTPGGPVVAASAVEVPFLVDRQWTEGPALNHLADAFGGVDIDVLDLIEGHSSTILLYDAALGFPDFGGLNSELRIDVRDDNLGGSVAVNEEDDVGATDLLVPQGKGQLLLLPGAVVPGKTVFFGSIFRAEADFVAGTVSVTNERTSDDQRGRLSLGIGYSALNPDVLLMSSNDGGFPPDGILALCGERFSTVSYSPGLICNKPSSDPRFTTGLLFNNAAQWPATAGNMDQYVWGSANQKWRVSRIHPGSTPCNAGPDAPAEIRKWTLVPPLDTFDTVGKRNFHQGSLDAAYDQHVQGQVGTSDWEPILGTRFGSVEGAVVMRREKIVTKLEENVFGSTLDGDAVVPPVVTPGSGNVTLTLDATSGDVTVSGSYQNLLGIATAASLRAAAPVCETAGVVLALDVSGGATGTINGIGTLTAKQVEDVLAGFSYIDLDTDAFPAGELRGQVRIGPIQIAQIADALVEQEPGSPFGLNTHPEFDNIDTSDPDTELWENFIGQWNLTVGTFAPKLFQLPGPGQSVPTRWTAVVPCMAVNCPPDLPIFQQKPTWAPTGDSLTFFGHALVQFWDVHAADAIGRNSALPRIYGPDPDGAAVAVETLELGGSVYCFVADFGGRLLVYEITDLLQANGNQPVLLQNWSAPASLTDDLPSPVWQVAVDRNDSGTFVYAAVQRVGIVVFRFEPGDADGVPLRKLRLLQTPGDVTALTIREDSSGDKTLLVADGVGGLRMLGYRME